VDVLDADGLLDENHVLPDEEMSLVIPWLLQCRPDENGLTVADTWRHAKPRLTPDETLLLTAYHDTWLSIWEVGDVEPGIGSRVTDTLTREERYIHDVRSSSTLQSHDSVLGMVLTCDGVSFFGGVHAQPLSPRFADAVVREAQRRCRVRTRSVAPAKLQDPGIQLELMALWCVLVDDMRIQPPPALQNTDGDPFLQTTDDFALLAPRDTVAARLESLAGAQVHGEDEDGLVFVITKAGNAVHRSWDNTVIGRAILGQAHLRVETNSTRRADSLRASVERHLRGMVQFRLRSEANTAQLLAASRSKDSKRPGKEPVPPEALEAMRAFRERHLHDWVDESIPALGGLTPRQAATTARGRKQLALLLKELDQTELRLPEEERIDLQWLREALGVP
jgi:hypothetical protein